LLAKAKEVTPTVAAEDGTKYVTSDGSEIMSDPTLHREAQSVAINPVILAIGMRLQRRTDKCQENMTGLQKK
jgi:hypothetical protein